MKNVHEVMLKTTNQHHLAALPSSDKQLESASGTDAHMPLYELQIHQVESEAQNKSQQLFQIKDGVPFSEFFDFSPSSLLSLRCDGTLDVINLAGARLLGAERTSLIGRSLGDFIAPESRSAFDVHMREVFNSQVQSVCEIALITADRRSPIVYIETIADESGRTCRMSLVEITERKYMENALRFIVQRGWVNDAGNVFATLAQYLGEILGVDHVAIAKLTEAPGTVETVAFYAKGNIMPNIKYALKGTPCSNVMDKHLCYYPQGIQSLFPDDTMLVDLGTESYAGISLWDSTGQSIGLIAVMDSKPLLNESSIIQTLKLVATRASAELERMHSDCMLQAREREFHTLAENTPNIIVRYDREYRCTYVNPAFERETGIAAKQAKNIAPDMQWGAGMPIAEYQAKLQQVMDTGVVEQLRTEWLAQDSGKTVSYEINIVPEYGVGNVAVGALVIGHNISTLLETERHIEELRTQLHELAVRRGDVCEEERKRIARDLHDELGQQLTALRLDVSLIRMKFGQDNPPLVAYIQKTIGRVDDTIQMIRNVASKLRPAVLDIGIVSALEWQTKEFVRKSGLHCELNLCEEQVDLDEERATAIFRIVQESLTNIARHAKAKKVEISLQQDGRYYLLEVRDDGKGYNPEAINKKTFGLIGIQERVLMLKGELFISSAPGAGTVVKVRIPVQAVSGKS